jgi:hypothetical protein
LAGVGAGVGAGAGGAGLADSAGAVMCAVHAAYPLEFYCTQCDQLVCCSCGLRVRARLFAMDSAAFGLAASGCGCCAHRFTPLIRLNLCHACDPMAFFWASTASYRLALPLTGWHCNPNPNPIHNPNPNPNPNPNHNHNPNPNPNTEGTQRPRTD